MKYLVNATEGPGFATPEEAVEVLEELVLPTFDALMELEKKGRIVGGLPVGERSFVFIAEAASNDELDAMLRALPLWGILDWEVTPLQTVARRAEIEREVVDQHKFT